MTGLRERELRRSCSKSEYRRAAARRTRLNAEVALKFPGARPVWPIRCGKVAYPDRAVAEHALTAIVQNGEPREKTPVRTYHCPECGDWHLTSRPTPPATASTTPA